MESIEVLIVKTNKQKPPKNPDSDFWKPGFSVLEWDVTDKQDEKTRMVYV